MYDVIIIGAGPAGCTAAKVLSDNKYRVLLVEKHVIPRYKSCSGQLIKKTIDLVRRYYGESVPEWTMCLPYENKGMILTDDNGKEYRYEQSGLNVWRSEFDKWLSDKALEAGAEVRDNTTVIACKEENGLVSVTLKGRETYDEQARFVIDCEGVVGTVKKQLLGVEPRYIYTYQTFNEGCIDLDHHYFYAYLQPELSEYDAWFNVKDNQLVLGVSVKDKDKAEYYYPRFIEYLKEKHDLIISEQKKTDRWLMPDVQPGCPIDYGVGRILFAGEIAGFLNPMGEGISSGIESGYCAASAVMEHFNDPGSVCDSYKDHVSDLRDYMRRQWAFVADISDSFRRLGF